MYVITSILLYLRHMLFRLVLIVICLLIMADFAAAQTGIFLTTTCDKHSEKFVVQATGAEVCVTPQPLVDVEGFQLLGPLVTGIQMVYFDVTFTQSSFARMNGIIGRLTNTSFVLFIEGEAIVTIPFEDVKNTRVHRFTAPLSGYFFIESRYGKLKELMEAKGK